MVKSSSHGQCLSEPSSFRHQTFIDFHQDMRYARICQDPYLVTKQWTSSPKAQHRWGHDVVSSTDGTWCSSRRRWAWCDHGQLRDLPGLEDQRDSNGMKGSSALKTASLKCWFKLNLSFEMDIVTKSIQHLLDTVQMCRIYMYLSVFGNAYAHRFGFWWVSWQILYGCTLTFQIICTPCGYWGLQFWKTLGIQPH